MFGKINFGNVGQVNSNNHEKKVNHPNSQSNKQAVPPKNKKIKKAYKANLQKNYEDLQGAKFRLLNQMLYTNQSVSAVNYFKDNKQDFDLYHEGYRHQTSKWSFRPVDQIIQFILRNKSYYVNKKIADLGCGQGFLFQELKGHGFAEKKIKSYDLVSIKPFIKAVDVANLPLKSGVIDLAIFCLSLMGTNYLQFIKQAHRILRQDGELIISEVESRSSNWEKFIEMVNLVGFVLVNDGMNLLANFNRSKDQPRFFRTIHFRKSKNTPKHIIGYKGKSYKLSQFSTLILQSCTYKKR